MKLATKSLLRLPNETMVLEDNFLNHDLAGPFKVAEKALHITLSEYPWSDIKFLYESRWSMGSVFPLYTPSWDGSLNLDDTLTFITLSANKGSIFLIKSSTVIGAFAPVLMASIRASRSLYFWVVNLSQCLGAQLSWRGDLPLLLVSSPSVSRVRLEDRDSERIGLLSHLECKLYDRTRRLLVECSRPVLWRL
ncbi:hypothetical protein Acr_07g0010060 [Actinidia rufa]|uniref:Uncharacterized protein n=1 Tax=Actinidia rufa TaxID=165716 RepID=A0A7J0EXY7_9ERIC|nr:hypothetical protein Acr_07g0010060 [Actinidia rufa]